MKIYGLFISNDEPMIDVLSSHYDNSAHTNLKNIAYNFWMEERKRHDVIWIVWRDGSSAFTTDDFRGWRN